ncbi:MAG: type II toxin-antitoxin system Phd/YefM family antitoxin [Acidimicrobiales bacterium]
MTIHDAKSRLSELIREAEAGVEVIVARDGKPVTRIVAWRGAVTERSPERGPVGGRLPRRRHRLRRRDRRSVRRVFRGLSERDAPGRQPCRSATLG